MSVARSLLYAAANLLHPRMLWLMVWPMLVALALWGSVALVAWGTFAVRLAVWLQQALDYALSWSHVDFATAALVAANVLLFIAFVPLVYLTALFILSVFGMQKMVGYVASRSYPQLERRRGGGIAGTGWNGLAAFAGMLGLAVVSIPLWLLPPLWPIIPLVILGWVNQRLLRYDALAEHADAEEMRRLFRRHRGTLYLLGLLLALAAYIPIVGFFAPVLFGLAFIHYLLGALAAERAAHNGALSPI
ncbi:MAG: EI24 domain-containing protein [Betaproteobacteria bacterium]|jgi:CysZ protein|nr:EI24 domain-containing protein [Betaproteobacteria bacterium]